MLFEAWFEIKTKKIYKKSPEYCVSKTHKKVSYFKSQFIAKKTKKTVIPHCTTVFDGRQIKSGI